MNAPKKVKDLFQEITNLSNNNIICKTLDGCSAVCPNKSVGEERTRAADRIAAREGRLGERIEKEPGLINGHLNRDKILIGTTAFYSDERFTEEDIVRIADGGFDFLITVDDGSFGEKLVDNCGKHDVAIIAKDRSLPGGPDIVSADIDSGTLFADYKKKPAQVGDHGWDEPNVKDFPYMGRFYERYKEALPEQFLFNNLFPGGATKKQTGATSFREYVERYSSEVGTDYISTDIYPFHPLKVINKFAMKFCLHTYHCLGDVCRRESKDFWLYIQTQGMWFSHIYALPTFELIKWQMYASLCYGARSIIHVAYTPVWGNDAYAMLDKAGNLTEQYIYAKRANAEIQKLSDTIKNYRSLGVLISDSKNENPHFSLATSGQREDSAEQGFTGIPLVGSVKSESTALVGYFKSTVSDSNALMLVNCKDLYDASASQKVCVSFTSPVTVKIYEHGALVKRGTVKSRLLLDVGSCDGTFVEFKEID